MSLASQLSRIDLNLLTVLDALLSERSVTRAAAKLGLSQPAASNALARLREVLSDPLLVRTRRGMTPTARALALEAPLRDALGRLAHALLQTGEFEAGQAHREFTLSATDYVQFVLLGGLMKTIGRDAPGVVLHVQPMAFDSAASELEAGNLDLVLSGVSARQQGLHRRTLFHDRIVCMLARDHPYANGALTLERYLELSHIEVHTGTGPGLADQTLAKLGKARRLALTVPHFLVTPFVMPGSDYCFTLAERIALPMAKLLPLKVFPLPFEVRRVTVWAYWHERMHGDPAHAWLRHTIAELANELDSAPRRAPRSKTKRARKGDD
jgi:DNA-binding transcriptional LysR family regulator